MTACDHLEQTHALADGELTGAAAAAARDHLATCATCQAELADALQLDALASDRVAAAIPLAWYRRRRTQLIAAAAIAAAVAVYLALPRPAPVEQVALAPHRLTEARLAWAGAAGYRDYDVPRAGEAPHEAIDLMAIARLDRRGDAHGVGVLELLNGERRQAETYLARAAETPDVLADRAALALASGRPAKALALADAALGHDAAHGPALWNRGLALRDLGLPRASAIAFRAVAARNEPGWAGEATARATALDAETDATEHRFERINLASVALAAGQGALSLDDARAMPGFARGILYDAIRSAPSPERLAALRPIADAIDAADHGTALADAITRAAEHLRPELARGYGTMIQALAVEAGMVPAAAASPPVPTGEARTRWLAALRAAHADDLLIGALMKLSADRRVVDAADAAELARLTAASPDPWMQLLGLQQQAEAALARDDLAGAEAILLAAKQRCAAPTAPSFRCIKIGGALGQLYVHWQRLPEAHAVLTAAWQLARSSGDWITQESLLSSLATLASISDETEVASLPLVRAYVAEYVQRFPASLPDGRCDRAAWGRQLEAMLLMQRLEFPAARRAFAGPPCASTPDSDRAAAALYVRAKLAARDGSATEIATVRADIAALRPAARRAERVLLDHSDGLMVVRTDRAAGEALLRGAIAEAKPIAAEVMKAHKAAAWSYSALVDAAARAGEGDRVLALIAEEQGLAAPTRCALGLAIEDDRRAIAVRDAAGAIQLHTDAAHPTPALDAARFVPRALLAALAGCATVDVLARPPLHGVSRMLPDAIAWRYLARRAHPVGASPARQLVVADVEPPAALELPRLATWAGEGERLSGTAATPGAVLAAIATAGEVVIHAHGIVDVAQPEASFLALSPEPDGRYALTTRDVRAAQFPTSPLVILAACRSSRAAPVSHDTWSLPAAFVYAGARVVIASTAPIPDREAGPFFDAVRGRIRTGAPAATALRDERLAWLARGGADWVRDIIIFE